jgi:hypothetical protein
MSGQDFISMTAFTKEEEYQLQLPDRPVVIMCWDVNVGPNSLRTMLRLTASRAQQSKAQKEKKQVNSYWDRRYRCAFEIQDLLTTEDLRVDNIKPLIVPGGPPLSPNGIGFGPQELAYAKRLARWWVNAHIDTSVTREADASANLSAIEISRALNTSTSGRGNKRKLVEVKDVQFREFCDIIVEVRLILPLAWPLYSTLVARLSGASLLQS